MFASIFRYKGLVWRIFNTLTDILALSLLWAVCSLPLVTLGASCTALYDSVVRCIRFREERPYARFFRTWRAELKVSIPSTVLWGAAAAVGVFLLLSLRQMGRFSDSSAVAAAAWYVVLVIPVGAACWAFPILSRFTFDFLSLNKTAAKFALGHLPSTVLIVLITLESAQLVLRWYFPLLFMLAVCALLSSLFIEPVFARHGGGLKKAGESANDSPPPSDT